MSTATTIVSDIDLIAAVKRRFGFADVSITRHTDRPRGDRQGERELWLIQAIKRTTDSAWEVNGRRRTTCE